MHAELPLHEATFRALGSHCRIVCDVERTVIDGVHRLEDLEARWSRFVPTSEVSKLNAAGGAWGDVSDITRRLLSRAREAFDRTNGVLNPLLLNALSSLGYDRSHELLADVTPGVRADGRASSSPTWIAPSASEIEIESGRVRLPAGTAFDPGGLGKGLAADIVMEDLLAAGATWALVSLGGDLRFGGAELASRGWETQIEEPRAAGQVWGSVSITSGALATSSVLSRRWTHGGTVHHHLLDPATGLPAAGRRIAATVHAAEAWWADVVAKVLVIDATVGRRHLEDWEATALVFEEGGMVDFGLGAVETAPLAPT